MNEARADIGLIGLAVMGQNIVLNMDDHGYTVAVFNRTVSKVDEFLLRRRSRHEGHRDALGPGTVRGAEDGPGV